MVEIATVVFWTAEEFDLLLQGLGCIGEGGGGGSFGGFWSSHLAGHHSCLAFRCVCVCVCFFVGFCFVRTFVSPC